MQYPSYRNNFFWGVGDVPALERSLTELFGSLAVDRGLFASDNLVTWGRNLGFLDDKPLMAAWSKHAERQHERAILWRTATLAWAGRQALRRDGAFVECGTYRGTTAHILLDALGLDRPFHLYDLFEEPEQRLPEHGPELYAFVQARFAGRPNVVVTRGRVPESLANAPERIAFLHIDMNSREAEVAALDALVGRIVPGGVIVLDDYGWLPYREQFLAEREWFQARGLPVLEMPTGQAVVIV